MSGFIENRESEASEKAGSPERMLTWHGGVAMLPLVSRIARDVTEHHGRLAGLRRELAGLERNRRQLPWPLRARRYQLADEVVVAEAGYRRVVAELEALGVALLAPEDGLVGFPTLVNERRAYFSWRPGEETLGWWNYATDRVRRPVPEEWTEMPREAWPRRVRPRKK
ncbi:MAG: DUF2203 family protein [Gemmataceae bacterium]